MSVKRTLRNVTPTAIPAGGSPESFETATAAAPYEPTPAGVIETQTAGGVETSRGSLDAGQMAPVGVIGAPEGEPIAGPDTAVVVTNAAGLRETATPGVTGDWDESDFKLPVIRLVQGSGELVKLFNTASVILGDEVLLQPPDIRAARPEDFFRFVPIALTKQFRERLSQAEITAGAIPRLVNSAKEVEEAGGSTQWLNNERPSWEPTAKITMLVEQPAAGAGKDLPVFVLELDGKLYAPAVYYASGGAFRSMAQALYNASLTSLTVPKLGPDGVQLKNEYGGGARVGFLPKNFWTWRTTRKPSGDYTVFAPEVRMAEVTGPEVRAQAQALMQ